MKRYICTDDGARLFESYGCPIMEEDSDGDYYKVSEVNELLKEARRVLEGVTDAYEDMLISEWATHKNPEPHKTDEDCIKARELLAKLEGE